MTTSHSERLERIFRERFDEVIRPRAGTPEDRQLQAGFDEWFRWLVANGVKVRPFDTIYKHDPERLVRIKDPTGFRILFVPVELAERALILEFLP